MDFTEKLTFPGANFDISSDVLDKLLTNLLLMLGISYWKLYCPKKIELKNKILTRGQADFWNKVYTKGLGDFFYQNKIDFRGIVGFPYGAVSIKPIEFKTKDRSLLMLGGGKDSIIAAEVLNRHKKSLTPLIINSHFVHKAIVNLIGIDPVIIKREVDPKLLEIKMNNDVYKGHVPISAIYAFIALVAAVLYDYRYIISSNEASANYGNVEYLGEIINHQWSKSLEFEQLFQDYVKTYIIHSVYYFSLLRPLREIKIAQLFGKYPRYFSSFSSCNRNFTIKKSLKGKWCGQCPKCAFIFAMLSAFLTKEEVVKIFNRNLFADESLIRTYKELLGIEGVKPFECVGTPDEVKLALYFVGKKGEFNNDIIIRMFEKEVLPTIINIEQLKEDLLSISDRHCIPKEFRPIIEDL